MDSRIHKLMQRIKPRSRQGTPSIPAEPAEDASEVSSSSSSETSPEIIPDTPPEPVLRVVNPDESLVANGSDRSASAPPRTWLGLNPFLVRNNTRPVREPLNLDNLPRIELFDRPYEFNNGRPGPSEPSEEAPPNKESQGRESNESGPEKDTSDVDGAKSNNSSMKSLSYTSFNIDGFRLDDFDVTRHLSLPRSHGSSSVATTVFGVGTNQSVEEDSLLEPNEYYTELQLAQRNRIRCPVCHVANPWDRTNPLANCDSCGADFTRELEGVDPVRQRASTVERDARILPGLEYDRGLRLITDNQGPLRPERAIVDVLDARNMSGNTLSAPNNATSGPSGSSENLSPPLEINLSANDNSPKSIVIQTIRGAESVVVPRSGRFLTIYFEMRRAPISRHQVLTRSTEPAETKFQGTVANQSTQQPCTRKPQSRQRYPANTSRRYGSHSNNTNGSKIKRHNTLPQSSDRASRAYSHTAMPTTGRRPPPSRYNPKPPVPYNSTTPWPPPPPGPR
ncbi:hypothetical protein T440DRAFT_148508 [Plenodomus tracheiphilus IPT5]|uniref:Uncharacterized protein n=1 Tax=Plenodomus tracheiphilus IPT5 TaxID=1408161 RepID=A0A6A7B0D9_9PLEO|nr:hypothetical protein T440DRAFT_148508 [Plenodomus tracheiphilus IPT5]